MTDTTEGGAFHAYTIPQWCALANISKTKFYSLPPEDRPTVIRIGGSPRISHEESVDFFRRMNERAKMEAVA